LFEKTLSLKSEKYCRAKKGYLSEYFDIDIIAPLYLPKAVDHNPEPQALFHFLRSCKLELQQGGSYFQGGLDAKKKRRKKGFSNALSKMNNDGALKIDLNLLLNLI